MHIVSLTKGMWYVYEYMRKLYRSDTDKVFAGIMGGLGEYMDMDAVVLRLVALVVICISGFFPGALAYIIAIFVVPKRLKA